jgi:hypothetical protein
MQIVLRLGLIALFFCISACIPLDTPLDTRIKEKIEKPVVKKTEENKTGDTSNGESNSEQTDNSSHEGKEPVDEKNASNGESNSEQTDNISRGSVENKKPVDASNEESNSEQTGNTLKGKGDEKSSTDSPASNESKVEDSSAKSEQDVCPVGGEKHYFEDIELTVVDRGDDCFNWKIKNYYENDIEYSYAELTLVTRSATEADKLIDALEKVKGNVGPHAEFDSLIVIKKFNAQTFSRVIKENKNPSNGILDIILTRCEKQCNVMNKSQ